MIEWLNGDERTEGRFNSSFFSDDSGSPDLCILFTGALSHKMLQSAEKQMKGSNTIIARCPTSSMDALRTVLETFAK